MPAYEPAWLSVADVKEQLRLAAADTGDDDLVTRCAAAVEPQVQRARPDGWPAPAPASVRVRDPATGRFTAQVVDVQPVYTPDAETYQAAVMLAARLVRRRNSPGGVETFGESVTYVSRYDPEIGRALRTGLWALPGVG
jgi:hypothetical protein